MWSWPQAIPLDKSMTFPETQAWCENKCIAEVENEETEWEKRAGLHGRREDSRAAVGNSQWL